MRYVVYKVFTIGSFEKEEKWLNEMSAKGMQLISVGFCRYEFEEGTPGEYIYRIELLEHLPSHAESVAYIKFLEETGVDHIGSYMRWVYFRKKAADGPFELYSEISSKIKHYKRINQICSVVTSIILMFTIIYAWEAWKQYSLYLDWRDRGFSSKPYHSSYIFLGIYFIVLTAIVLYIGHPIRKTLKALKKEQKIME